MKNLTIAAFLFMLSVSIFSCKKSEIKTINGKWYYSRSIESLYVGDILQYRDTTKLDSTGSSIVFNSNGSGEINARNENEAFRYTISGNTLTIVSDTTSINGVTNPATTSLSLLQLTNNSLKWQGSNVGDNEKFIFEDDLIR